MAAVHLDDAKVTFVPTFWILAFKMSIQPIIKVTFDRRCSFMFANCADMF